MLKFINNVRKKEQTIGYELFNKKRAVAHNQTISDEKEKLPLV